MLAFILAGEVGIALFFLNKIKKKNIEIFYGDNVGSQCLY